MKISIFAIIALLLVVFNTTTTAQNHLKHKKKSIATQFMESNPNILADIKWRTNGIGFTKDNHKEITLDKVNEHTTDMDDHFGHFATFQKDGTFENHYSAQCGNDCHVHLEGTYQLVNDSEVKIHVNTITYSGYCKKNETLKPNITYTYSIIKMEKNQGYTLRLK